MERGHPSAALLAELCGLNKDVLRSLCYGLHETPALQRVYPLLNLDELVVFAASSWKGRSKGDTYLAQRIEYGTPYDIFAQVNKIGYPWLNKYRNRNMASVLKDEHRKLNPYGRNLEYRLSRVDGDTARSLRGELEQPAQEYRIEAERDLKYPLTPSGQIIPLEAFAAAEELRKYPSRTADLKHDALWIPAQPFEEWIQTV